MSIDKTIKEYKENERIEKIINYKPEFIDLQI